MVENCDGKLRFLGIYLCHCAFRTKNGRKMAAYSRRNETKNGAFETKNTLGPKEGLMGEIQHRVVSSTVMWVARHACGEVKVSARATCKRATWEGQRKGRGGAHWGFRLSLCSIQHTTAVT